MPGFTWFCPFPVPPISPCLKKYTPHRRRESKIVIHQHEKYEKVDASFESLGYEKSQDVLTTEEAKKYGISVNLALAVQRNIVIFLTAITAGVCVASIDFVEHHSLYFRFDFLKKQFGNYYERPEMHFLLFFYWLVLTLTPALIAGLLTIFIDPVSFGGGIPGIIAFLNGVSVPKIVNLKVLLAKVFGTMFMLMAVIATGKEGPIIHLGVILGASMPMLHIPFTNIRFFRLLQNDRERRDMASVGIACGVSAAFISPLAGVFLALEECVSYCSAQLTTRILLGSLITSFSSAFLISYLLHDCIGCELNKDLLFLTVHNSIKFLDYHVYEFPLFILIGIIGGITGSIWNCLEMQISYLRQRFVKKKLDKLLDLGVLTTITAVSSFIITMSIKECHGGKSHDQHFPETLQLHCPKGEYPTVALFFFQNDNSLMNTLISEERIIGIKPLVALFVYYFVLSAAFMGASISGGVFLPNLITGAVWGRIFAELLQELVPRTKEWCYPQKYAFLAAGAHIGGTTRTWLSLGCILLESSGNASFGLPIFVVIITTKFVADMITHPIYHAECLMKGMPLLEKTPPPYCSWIPVKNIMNKNVIVLPKVTTIGVIWSVLNRTKHNGFPVVDPSRTSTEDGIASYGQLLGLVFRRRLKIILKNKLYKKEKFEDVLKVIRNQFDSVAEDFLQQDISAEEEDEKERIDLDSFMQISPMFVQMGTSFTSVYALMAGLGMRHLLVVNNSNEVVGIVTRKDIAVHKYEITCCTVESKVVPLVGNKEDI